MKKQLLNLSFVIVFLGMIFSMFGFYIGESKAFAANPPVAQTKSADNLNKKPIKDVSIPKTIPEKNTYKITHMQKTGFKYKLFKFLTAMLGVLVSSLAIFAGLKIYKKLVLKNNSKSDTIDYNKNLESPKDFKEAINLFLDKTDK